MELVDRIKTGGIAIVSLVVFALVTSLAAWLTHIITCLQNGEWGFLIAGALAFPIAIIHGIGIWLGLWG
ncbi:MAG: hypothetical protein GC136_01825 [Alphaproteobacteria bacterium]|nr:hypothetical protein [Alphaproteobacteria bacterium]